MNKYRKLLSLCLSLALVIGSLFVGAVSTGAVSTTIINTYDDENTSYRTEVMGDENNSFLTVNGVEESWYRFAAWSASVEKETAKTGAEQNAVHFVKAAKYNYKWPAAVKIYNNDASLSHFKAAPNTTYEIKLRYCVDAKPSVPINLQVRSRPTINLFETFTYDETLVCAKSVVTITDVTNGWVEAVAEFTTPNTDANHYLNLTLSSANSTNASNVSVWVDDIEISKCTIITAHNYNGNDKQIRVSDITTLADLEVPTYEGYRLEGVYTDALYTNKLLATDKLNTYTDIYYNWVKLSNDTYYCGFEDYAEQLSGQNATAQMTGMSYDGSISQLTSADAYAGGTSMKNTLEDSGIVAFELRNNKVFEIYAGKEYKVSFAYKTDANAKIQLGVGKANDICGTSYGIEGVQVTATDSWKTAEVTFTADKGTAQDCALAMLIFAENAATVYIDDVLIMNTEDISFSEMPELEYSTNWYPTLSAFGNNESSELWSGSVATSFAVGDGTETLPYEISSGEELALAITSGGGADKFYKLTKDIYLNDIDQVNWYNGATCFNYTPKNWYAHGRTFQGTIDGNGHTIYGIYYDMNTGARTSYRYGCGLIPEVAANTSVKISNLGVDCVYINYESGASAFVGCALSGASVDISGCYVGDKATIIGADSGAFQGHSYQVTTININNSYSLGEITGSHSYGLVGNRWSGSINISNSYNGNGALLSMAANSKIVLSNCYQSEPGKITAGVTTLSANNMKGEDVLTNASKMANLNTNGVFESSTLPLADAEYYIYLPEGTEFESTNNVTFYDTML
ncbi:MAG: carbohydrate binding domain-containing protein, partial [Clostridia bacterium]|nr:carbohydrate binding domain-containing protein [Clostridia bacterium]